VQSQTGRTNSPQSEWDPRVSRSEAQSVAKCLLYKDEVVRILHSSCDWYRELEGRRLSDQSLPTAPQDSGPRKQGEVKGVDSWWYDSRRYDFDRCFAERKASEEQTLSQSPNWLIGLESLLSADNG